MGKVQYSIMVSLDGYMEDESGGIGFSAPDPEVHRDANEQTRLASAFLFGRRLYEVMEEPWTKAAAAAPGEVSDEEAEFARLYLDTPRYVFSDTLDRAGLPEGVKVVRSADAHTVVRRLKAETEGHLDLGGAALAASLADLVDEYRLYVMPVALGAGKPCFQAGRPLGLRLLEHRAFTGGTLLLRYAADGARE